jgi:hypothetical protein
MRARGLAAAGLAVAAFAAPPLATAEPARTVSVDTKPDGPCAKRTFVIIVKIRHWFPLTRVYVDGKLVRETMSRNIHVRVDVRHFVHGSKHRVKILQPRRSTKFAFYRC